MLRSRVPTMLRTDLDTMRSAVDWLTQTGTKLSRHRHSLAFLLFGLVICGIYFPVLDGTRSLITNSNYHSGPFFVGDLVAGGQITLPLERLASVSWSHLQLPVVDPFQGYGIPLLANQGVPVYFPQLIAHALFPSNYSIWIVLNLIAIAFGAYLLASSFGQNFPAAVAVGMLASLAGVAPPNLNVAMLNPFAVFPFVLLSIRYSLDPQSSFRKCGLLGTATSVTMLALSGFPEVLPLMAVVIIVYAVGLIVHFRTLRRRAGLIVSTAICGGLGVVIGSLGLIPPFAAVRSGAGINTPTEYLYHAPPFFLSTLTIPSLTQRAMVASPQDLGQTVWTLGSPILVLVLVLSVALVLRPAGKEVRWYVWPSVVLTLFGILGYANVLHVLQIFDLPVVNSIAMVRFLQFAWWLPWCLLVGAVITNVRHLRWYDAGVSLVVAGVYDWYFVLRFRDQLVAEHLNQYLHETKHAVILAGAISAAFVLGILIVRWTTPRGASVLMTGIVIASCLYYLPTNFYPASAGSAVSSVRIPGTQANRAAYLAYLATAQQPTRYYSVQLFGPLIPKAYGDVMNALFSSAQTNGLGALWDSVPSLGFATLDPRTVGILRTLGVNQLVLGEPLASGSIFGDISPCGTSAPTDEGTMLCYLGRSTNVGVSHTGRGYAYEVLGASPLVQKNPQLIAVPSTDVGLTDLLKTVSPASTVFPSSAYVTSNNRTLKAARHVVGLSRRATADFVDFSLRSDTAGVVVLRSTYFPGMRASVNGQSVSALPVDGGLWTAVQVKSGDSRVVLTYETTSDRVELCLAVFGLFGLVLAWLGLAAKSVARKRRTVRGQGQGGPTHDDRSQRLALTRQHHG